MLSLLEEEFPEVCRIVAAVYPSAEDDVVTSPYNSVLAMRELTEHADCVLPIENQVWCRRRCSYSLSLSDNNHKVKLSPPVSFSSLRPLLLPQSLADIVNKIKHMSVGEKPGSVIKRDSSVISGRGGLSGAEKPFDAMNNIVANLLLNLTRYRTSVHTTH